VFSIYVDGTNVYYYQNGVSLSASDTLVVTPYRFRSYGNQIDDPAGYTITNVRFYPTGKLGPTGPAGGGGGGSIQNPADFRILTATGASTTISYANSNLTWNGSILEVQGDVSANSYNGPGGTAGAPHYTFSDDRTTGMFFPASGNVAFTTSGSEKMRILANGNVGIGTTNPLSILDISGTQPTLRIGDFSATRIPQLEFVRGTSTTFGGDLYTDWRIRNEGGNLIFRGQDNSLAPSGFDALTLEYPRGPNEARMGFGTTAPRSGWVSNSQSGVSALDVAGQVYGRLPVYVISNNTDPQLNTNYATYANTYFYITSSAFASLTLPGTSYTVTSNGGTFFQFKNSTSSYLSITLTSNANLPTSVSIAPSNALTFVISPTAANTFLLF
jgi:hypothetical protein